MQLEDLENPQFQNAFSELLGLSFNNYNSIAASSWFGSVRIALNKMADIPDPLSGQQAIILKDQELKKQEELNKKTTDGLKDVAKAIKKEPNKLVITDESGQQYDTEKIKSSVSFFKEASAEAFNAFVTLKKTAVFAADVIDRIAKPHRQALAGIKEAYGGVTMMGSKAANDMGTTLEGAYENFAAEYTKTNSELKAQNKDLLTLDEDFLDGIPEALKGFENQVNASMMIFEDPKDAFRDYMDIVNQTARTYGAEIAENFKGHAQEIAIINKGLGLSSQQMQKIITRNIDRTGEANIDTLKEFNRFAQGVANATGKSAKIVADTMAAVVTDVQNFGNVTDEEAARISGALLEIGIAADTLGKLVGKFANFDQAATAVGNLTAAFGLNLDAMEMMMLANEDQEQFLFRMRDAFEEQGLNFQDMSLAQQKLISSQMGLTIEESARLFDFENEITSMEELKPAAEDMSPEEAVRQLKSDIVNLVDKGGPALEEALKRTKSFGLGGKFLKDVMGVQQSLGKTVGTLGVLEAKANIEINNKVIEGIKTAGTEADKIIEKLNKKLEQARGTLQATKAATEVAKKQEVTIDTSSYEELKELGPFWKTELEKTEFKAPYVFGEDVGGSVPASLLDN